ncbi:MAG: hypothetical protein JJU35_09360 [Balneolales bacterium]|nr:hypothetical protein [Balneolales bacterium]
MNRFSFCITLSLMLALLPFNTACSSTAQPLEGTGTAAPRASETETTPAPAPASQPAADAEQSPELHRDLDISRELLAGLLREQRGSSARTGAIEAMLLSPERMLFMEVTPNARAAQPVIRRDIRTEGRVIIMRDQEAGVDEAEGAGAAAAAVFSSATREAGLSFLADYVSGLGELSPGGEVVLLLRDAGTDAMVQLSATRTQIEQLRSGRITAQQFETRAVVRDTAPADRALLRFAEVMATGFSAHPENPQRVAFEAPVYAQGLGLMLRGSLRPDAAPRMSPRVSVSDSGRRILEDLPAENIQSIEILNLPEGGQEIRIHQKESDPEAEAEAGASFEVLTRPGGAREVRVIQADAVAVSGLDYDLMEQLAQSDSLFMYNIARSDSLFIRTMAEQDSLFDKRFGVQMQGLGEMLSHLSGSLQVLRGSLVASMDSLRAHGAFHADSLRGQVLDFDFDFDASGLAGRVRDEAVSNFTVIRRGAATGGASFWPGREVVWQNERQRRQAEAVQAETLRLLTEYAHLLRSLGDEEHLLIALDLQGQSRLWDTVPLRLKIRMADLRAHARGSLSEAEFERRVVKL